MGTGQRARAARALLGTMPLVMRTIGNAMRNGGSSGPSLLPQQYRLLGAIGRRPRTLGQVAAIQGVTPATATTIVTTLENRGWVRRDHDPDDRRRVVVSLTEEGRETLASNRRIVEDAMAELLGPLSDDQIDLLLAGLAVLGETAQPPGW